MNGATAEPWASTISTPNRPVMTNIGNSQYFFRARRNAQSSLIIDMMAALKLVGERIGRRAGRLARRPVALGARIEPCAQRVPAGEPHDAGLARAIEVKTAATASAHQRGAPPPRSGQHAMAANTTAKTNPNDRSEDPSTSRSRSRFSCAMTTSSDLHPLDVRGVESSKSRYRQDDVL